MKTSKDAIFVVPINEAEFDKLNVWITEVVPDGNVNFNSEVWGISFLPPLLFLPTASISSIKIIEGDFYFAYLKLKRGGEKFF